MRLFGVVTDKTERHDSAGGGRDESRPVFRRAGTVGTRSTNPLDLHKHPPVFGEGRLRREWNRGVDLALSQERVATGASVVEGHDCVQSRTARSSTTPGGKIGPDELDNRTVALDTDRAWAGYRRFTYGVCT